ncbi:chorismate-binding protein [Aquimarina agarilytica]|uniref:chorismate-binding protein n=1 Tax=Aquimarina agarilytica TaxID=1087449 RepID=UPI000288F8D7|nr:chorismate-binding protein [Aquimarina agarilytica]
MITEDFFEKINSHWKSQLPFVIFKKPNDNDISVYLNSSNEIKAGGGFNEAGFVFSPFMDTSKNSIWFPRNSSIILTTHMHSDQIDSLATNNTSETNTNHKEKHIRVVEKALEKLRLNELQKVIVSRVETLSIDEHVPIEWFKKMCSLYPNTFCYCWYHPKVGMWLGASPETLVSLKKSYFETIALAGTMAYNDTTGVEWGKKEIEEQQMVVDSMLKALTPIVFNIQKGETTTQKAGSLLHLKTVIKGQLKKVNQLGELVEVLHPTSAVCGLPKLKAQEFILGNEGYHRSYYTGYLGEYIPEGNTQLYVNLRCMEIEQEQAKIYVGGGITAASDPVLEWEETVNKSKIMKAVL